MKISKFKKCMFNIIFALVFTNITSIAFSGGSLNEAEAKKELSDFAKKIEKKNVNSRMLNDIISRYDYKVFPYMENYFEHSDWMVRRISYMHSAILVRDCNDVIARREIVHKLLERFRDDEENAQNLGEQLPEFVTASDFNDKSKEILSQMLTEMLAGKRDSVDQEIILLIGVADIKSELGRLKEIMEKYEVSIKKRIEKHQEEYAERTTRLESLIAEDPNAKAELLKREKTLSALRNNVAPWEASKFWACLRARARMGVKEDIARCIKLMESYQSENRKLGFGLKDISYVRQPEVVDYIYLYLKSDKMCPDLGADVIRISYAQRAAMLLATMLEGFPGNQYHYENEKIIKYCREWMAKQKEWKIIR